MIHRYIAHIQQKTNLSSQEAWWLLEHVLKPTPMPLVTQNELTEAQSQKLEEYIDQIARRHKPLAYVIGWVPFLDLYIEVQPPILIPRPETEEWLNQLIDLLIPKSSQIQRILDIGTGSGVIGLALAQKFPLAQITALDINPAALDLARKNATINNIQNIEFIKSDLFSALKSDQMFDLIVSNPPYIPRSALDGLSASVTLWEDHGALLADQDGLEILGKIIAQSADFLVPNRTLPFQMVLEIDRTQHESVKKIAQLHDWDCAVTQDLFGNWRTAWCNLSTQTSSDHLV